MVDPDDADEIARAHEAERRLFEGVVALEGSISGEHGIGFAKAPFMRHRAVAGRDRADEAGEAGVRSERDPEPGEDVPAGERLATGGRAEEIICPAVRATVWPSRHDPRSLNLLILMSRPPRPTPA